MTQLSNADKQARFRKKEYVQRVADDIFRHWQQSFRRHRNPRTPEDVRHSLDKAMALPSGWTEEDYQFALRRLAQCKMDLDLSMDQLANDVAGDWVARQAEFATTTDPAKLIADRDLAKDKAWALASHLVSASKLSNCPDADQAAAAMELLRFVGRALVTDPKIRCSQATAMCLATVGPQYDRPEWFAETLAAAIGNQIGRDLAHEVGRRLIAV